MGAHVGGGLRAHGPVVARRRQQLLALDGAQLLFHRPVQTVPIRLSARQIFFKCILPAYCIGPGWPGAVQRLSAVPTVHCALLGSGKSQHGVGFWRDTPTLLGSSRYCISFCDMNSPLRSTSLAAAWGRHPGRGGRCHRGGDEMAL